jgi:hypothetical protein
MVWVFPGGLIGFRPRPAELALPLSPALTTHSCGVFLSRVGFGSLTLLTVYLASSPSLLVRSINVFRSLDTAEVPSLSPNYDRICRTHICLAEF